MYVPLRGKGVMAAVLSLVYLDEQGIARVEGTNTKVKEIILDWIAYGYSPAEIHFQYPHLSMAQIHSAFAYYFAHQEEMDAEIEQDYQEVQALRAQSPPSVSREQLLQRLGRA